MKRLHVHVSVKDLSESVRFYQGLFATEPTVLKTDYAKWMLDDPCVNFAISTHSAEIGLNHLGIQVESDEELAEIEQRVLTAGLIAVPEKGANCCYAQSDKQWLTDPQGITWEAFHSTGEIATYGGQRDSKGACCAPASSPKVKLAEVTTCSPGSGCC
ncbi:ArsI/CadI family heavy metal resistance metalloenzyme [Chitinivorax sp. B]|uniref:ArsI/CadI family heavy metal resistance metalloenzyme n=1 Tax=Chitinivorax sp. B TaxID=2502235 RepID=UPI0010F63FC0|nr:ArsI/CadI family heavy metal resistance metalloenzyme [Chitinivorax sp. B]